LQWATKARGADVNPGRPALYTAIAPREAISARLTRQRETLERLERDAVKVVARLTPTYDAGRVASDPLS